MAGHAGLLFAGTSGAVPDNARYAGVFTATFHALTYTDKELPCERVRAFGKKVANSPLIENQLGPAGTSAFNDFLCALKCAMEKAGSWNTDAVKSALDSSMSIPGLFGNMGFTRTNHTAYNASVIGLTISNSTEEATSKQYRGLLRRAPQWHYAARPSGL